MLFILLSLIVGFIAGALVFRNNSAKAEKIVKDGQAVVATGKSFAKKLKNK